MRTTPRSRLLLVELLFDLLIFAVCAAVCISLLVQAHLMSWESQALTDAVYLAQTTAETGGGGGQVDGYTVAVHGETITVSRDGRAIYTLETGVA